MKCRPFVTIFDVASRYFNQKFSFHDDKLDPVLYLPFEASMVESLKFSYLLN